MKFNRIYLPISAILNLVSGFICFALALICLIVPYVSDLNVQEIWFFFLFETAQGAALFAFAAREFVICRRQGALGRVAGELLGISVAITVFSVFSIFFCVTVPVGLSFLLAAVLLAATVFVYFAFSQAKSVPEPDNGKDLKKDVERLNELHAAGAITEEELVFLKAELLGKD